VDIMMTISRITLNTGAGTGRFAFTHRDTMDALGAVLAYVSGKWYTLEYGASDDRWYGRAMRFMEDLYGRAARKEV
jgi:hypothetical protein